MHGWSCQSQLQVQNNVTWHRGTYLNRLTSGSTERIEVCCPRRLRLSCFIFRRRQGAGSGDDAVHTCMTQPTNHTPVCEPRWARGADWALLSWTRPDSGSRRRVAPAQTAGPWSSAVPAETAGLWWSGLPAERAGPWWTTIPAQTAGRWWNGVPAETAGLW